MITTDIPDVGDIVRQGNGRLAWIVEHISPFAPAGHDRILVSVVDLRRPGGQHRRVCISDAPDGGFVNLTIIRPSHR